VAQVNSGSINKVYSLSFTNPYATPDGVSLGYDVYRRDVDATNLSGVAPYTTSTTGAGLRLGLPLNEEDFVNLGFAAEHTRLTVDLSDPLNPPPQQYIDFINTFGEKTNTFRGNLGWARDTRDSIFYPTKGRLQEVSGEVGIPPGDLKYYRLTYHHQYLYPAASWLTISLNGELGYANGYGGKPLPFFKNYYAGGTGSVRGFQTASLGPRDINGNAIGGNKRVIGNAEILLPMPGLKTDKSIRFSLFVDAGNVFAQDEKVSFGDLRYSTGAAVSWFSPVGPLKFSVGVPIKKKEGDKIERFQFQLGSVF
jgi:outer membrane protein insertion porin family